MLCWTETVPCAVFYGEGAVQRGCVVVKGLLGGSVHVVAFCDEEGIPFLVTGQGYGLRG